MSNIIRIPSLLLLSLILTFLPEGLHAQKPMNIDSLETELKQITHKDTLYLDKLKTLVHAYFFSDPPLGIQYANEHLRIADSLQDKPRIARSHNMLGNLYKTVGMTGTGIPHFMKALSLYEEMGNDLWVANLHSNLGGSYEVEGRMEEALQEQLTALKIRKENGLTQGIDGVLGAIGNVYGHNQQHELALSYYQAAIDSAVAQGQEGLTSTYYGNIGNVYGRMEKYPQGLVANQKALKLLLAQNDQVGATRITHNVGILYRLMGQNDSALHYQSQAYESAERLNLLPLMQTSAQQLLLIYDTLGLESEAVKWARIDIQWMDSLFKQQKLQEARDAELKYKLEKEAMELQFQSETDTLQQEADRNRQRVVNTSLIIGLVMAIALAIVLFILFRQKRGVGILLESKVLHRTQQLSRANEKLNSEITQKEKAREDLREFVYKSSHDLKGPLTSIQGLVQVASITPPSSPYMPLIAQKVDKLDGVLQQLIDKAEMEHHSLQLSEVNLGEVLQKEVGRVRKPEEPATFTIEWELHLPDPVQTDPWLMRLAFRQLLQNAVDFGPLGQDHTITVRLTGSHGNWELQVADKGIGMDAKTLASAGSLFFRGSNQSRGAGLGLHIARESLHKLGMKLQLESVPGQGTKAHVLR